MSISFEPLGGGIRVAVDDHCRISEDGLLLARFAAPQETDIAADLGTGNGMIPLFWCRRHPPSHITAIEKEEAFCRLATESIAQSGAENTVTLICGDWNDPACLQSDAFSLITCNPPYFPHGGSRPCHDPLRTAARHETVPDLLPRLFESAAGALTQNGRFCICHRPERLADVMAAAERAGLVPRRLQFVQKQNGTSPWLFLLETAKSGTLRVMPTLIQEEKGTHTDVYKRLY